jgi:hypothetical protein
MNVVVLVLVLLGLVVPTLAAVVFGLAVGIGDVIRGTPYLPYPRKSLFREEP